jgi:hypothetical protein
MNPLTHLLASWIIAAKTTDNLRDRRLVSLAGVVPDLDGLSILVDYAHGASTNGRYPMYQYYHHLLTHGLPAAVVCSLLMAAVARQRWRVLCWTFVTFHLHLLCDYFGSRGPDKGDIWPIMYLGPWRQNPIWFNQHQWPLDSWQNWVITMILFVWALLLAVKKGDSFIGVINHRFDRVFVSVLRKWHQQIWPASNASNTPIS